MFVTNKKKRNAHRTARQRKDRKGAATVEFALIAPIMILFTFGMIEMGRLVMVKNAATQATREGARAASLPLATAEGVHSRVQNELELLSIQGATIETTPSDISSAEPGDTISVRVVIDPDTVGWAPSFFPFEVPDIVAESTMRRESTN